MGNRRANNQSKTVRAAGRVLSGRNAEAIKKGLSDIKEGSRTIGRVLVAAGAIDENYIEDDGGDEVTETAASALSLTASAFTDSVASNQWLRRFGATIDVFQSRLQTLALASLKEMRWSAPEVKTEEDRQTAIADMIDEFEELLGNLSDEYPNVGDNASTYPYARRYDEMAMAADAEEMQAGALSDIVDRRVWHDCLYTLIDEFRHRFLTLHRAPLDDLKGIDDEQARRNAITKLIGEMKELLIEHSSNTPPPIKSVEAANNTTVAEESEPPAAEVAAEVAADQSTTIIFQEGQLIQADSMALDSPIEVYGEIDAGQIQVEIQVEASNLHPIKGVLFPVDQVSESPPSVGPGLPLYVPREVAEKALNVANLPLEAAEGLSKHDRKSTCGVMSTAEIVNNNFEISGYLWNYNHSDKVAEILAAQEELGMSMNAHARGRVAIVAGRKVFWLTDLELLGGCILFAERATWQKTSFREAIAAGAQNLTDEWQPIAAQSNDNPPEPSPKGDEDDMDIQAQMAALNTSMDSFSNTVLQQIQLISDTVSSLSNDVNHLQQERENQIQAAAQQQQLQSQQEQRQLLVQALGEAIGSQFQQMRDSLPELVRNEVATLINPSRQPARRTAPITVQAENGASGGSISDLEMELVKVNAGLETLRTSGSPDRATRLKLAQRSRELTAQISALQ